MIFSFLKYIQPVEYSNILRKNNRYIFPVIEDVPKNIIGQCVYDNEYISDVAKNYDISWQLVQSGYIGEATRYTNFDKLPIIDEYRFLRKNFSGFWVFYTLLIRLISFKNPFIEIASFFRTRLVKRLNYSNQKINYEGLKNYNSSLVTTNKPLISVIIPTLNRYSYLENVLYDFENQTYTNFEIIIVDQSDDYNPDFYKKFKLKLNVIRQEEKALWLARNTAIKNAKGSFIALSEDDVRVKEDWLVQHLTCIDFFEADVSAGVFYPEGSKMPENRSFYHYAKQFATGNALLKKEVFDSVGLFDRQFEKGRMGDGEFGMRCYLNNVKSISNPKASCIDVKAPDGGLREFGSWDAFRSKKIFAPKPVPSVLYFLRGYFGARLTCYSLLRSIPLSMVPYRYKRNNKMLIVGFLVSIILLPFVVFKIRKSWVLSSKMIERGNFIEKI